MTNKCERKHLNKKKTENHCKKNYNLEQNKVSKRKRRGRMAPIKFLIEKVFRIFFLFSFCFMGHDLIVPDFVDYKHERLKFKPLQTHYK